MSMNGEINHNFGTPSGRLLIATKAVQVLDAAGKLPQNIPKELVELMGRGFLKTLVSDVVMLSEDKVTNLLEEILLRADSTDKEGLVLYFKFILDRIWQKFSGSVEVSDDESKFPPLSDLLPDAEEGFPSVDLLYLSSRVSRFIYELKSEGFSIRDWSMYHNSDDVVISISVMKNIPS